MQKYDPQQVALLANGLAALLSKSMTADEQNVLGNLLALMGASLLSTAALMQSNAAAETASGTSSA